MSRSLLRCVAMLGIAAASGFAQGIIATVAGTEWIFPADGRLAINAPLGRGLGVAADRSGNVFIGDPDNLMVMRVSSDGILRVVAGNGIFGFSGDGGPATSASLNAGFPMGIAVDAAGNLYIADTFNERVRRVTASGVISTVAGNGETGYTPDGAPATAARLNSPRAVAVDAAGALYIADSGNHRVRKVGTDGRITTIAGNGQSEFTGASLNSPLGVAVDLAGNVYIADYGNNRVRKVTPAGIISTVAGNGSDNYLEDGVSAVNSALLGPFSVAVDAAGDLYIDDILVVRKVSQGIITTVAGDAAKGLRFGGDGGPATRASLAGPFTVAVDAVGTLYIGEFANMRVRRVRRDGIISTLAGNAAFRSSGEGGPGALAPLYLPTGVAVDRSGNVYIAENQRARVRRLAADGTITTVAGNGLLGFPTEEGVPATSTSILFPARVAVDGAGNLYISDEVDHRVRRVAPGGIITTVAGNGVRGSSPDGSRATAASLNSPEGIAVDGAGNLYIADTGNQVVRRVAPDGTIRTVAGNGRRGYSGDGVQATSTSLADPRGVAVDSLGNIYIADTWNDRIRRVTPNGVITTVAGNGENGFSGDGGPALNARLDDPRGVFVDAAGNLYIADTDNHRIRRVTPNGIITTVAGASDESSFSGDGGPATSAGLGFPYDVAVDARGAIYIADTNNHRARAVLTVQPTFRLSTGTLSFTGPAGGTPTAAQNLGLSGSVTGLVFSIAAATESGGDWLRATPPSGSMPAAVGITADPSRLAVGTYRGTVTVTAPNASPPQQRVAVTFSVERAIPPKLSSRPGSLAFSFVQQAPAGTQTISVANAGGGTLDYSAAVSTSSGGTWLSVTPDRGTATAATLATLTVTANPAGLAAGTYIGQIAISSVLTGERLEIPVTMTVSAIQRTILLTQTGLTFTAVSGGGVVPPQSFGVANTGQGVMAWTATASALTGGTSWLSVAPGSGSSDASGTVPLVEAQVNPAGLAPGEYYSEVRVSASGADNSPQFLLAVLYVYPADRRPAPVVEPAALVFTGVAGETPGSQTVSVYNLTSRSVSFTSNGLTLSDRNWLEPGRAYRPINGTLAGDRPTRIVVQPSVTGLAAGVHRGWVNLGFEDGTGLQVRVLLVLAPRAGSATGAISGPVPALNGCPPTRLLPELTSLTNNFNVPAGWPSSLVVKVVDDCGVPMVSGSVVASFTNGDPPVVLASLRDGSWRADWAPVNVQQQTVTVTVKAATADRRLEGSSDVTGGMQTVGNPPVIETGAVLSAASFLKATESPLAPGALVSIFGRRLSGGTSISTTLPLPTELSGTAIAIGERRLPLLFTSEGQVNAQIPYGMSPNTRYQIRVRNGNSWTVTPVVVAETQPAIFTKSQTGKGQGIIVDTSNRLVELGNAAAAGQAIIIYCAGLGEVDPPVAAGAQAPSSPLSRTVKEVTATIGDKDAEVFFSGLAPGFTGLYQVNVFVPEGVTAGNEVPVVLSVAGQKSPAVTIAVR